MEKQKFDIEEGIAVQTQHLEHWKSILKPKVFLELQHFAVKNNSTAETGWDIARGIDLTTFILNYKL